MTNKLSNNHRKAQRSFRKALRVLQDTGAVTFIHDEVFMTGVAPQLARKLSYKMFGLATKPRVAVWSSGFRVGPSIFPAATVPPVTVRHVDTSRWERPRGSNSYAQGRVVDGLPIEGRES